MFTFIFVLSLTRVHYCLSFLIGPLVGPLVGIISHFSLFVFTFQAHMVYHAYREPNPLVLKLNSIFIFVNQVRAPDTSTDFKLVVEVVGEFMKF